MRLYSFWDNSRIKNILFEVSKETGYSYVEVEQAIKFMFISVKREISNPLSFDKILLHNFGSFFPRLILFKEAIRTLWRLYKKDMDVDKKDVLYLKLKKLFLMRKIFKNASKSK